MVNSDDGVDVMKALNHPVIFMKIPRHLVDFRGLEPSS